MQRHHLSDCLCQMSLTTWFLTIRSFPLARVSGAWEFIFLICSQQGYKLANVFMLLLSKQLMEKVSNTLGIRVLSASCVWQYTEPMLQKCQDPDTYFAPFYILVSVERQRACPHSPTSLVWVAGSLQEAHSTNLYVLTQGSFCFLLLIFTTLIA